MQFYVETLGFSVNGIWDNPAYGSVRRGEAVIEFGEGRRTVSGSGVCYIHVANADEVYQEWQSRELQFIGDFANRDYGCKDFRIRDNNGNLLIVGHALKNQDELLQKNRLA